MASTPPRLQHVPPPVRCPPDAPQLTLTRCRPRRPLRGFSEQLREAWAERRAAQRWHKGASVEPPYVEPAAEKGGAGARRALRGGRQPPCSASIGGEVVAVLDDERSRSLQQARRTAQVGPRRRRHRRPPWRTWAAADATLELSKCRCWAAFMVPRAHLKAPIESWRCLNCLLASRL
jgi:hypothetical protein